MKYFLVFHCGPDRGDYSVYWSSLVIAETEDDAKIQYCIERPEYDTDDFDDSEEDGLGIREVTPIT